MRIKLILEKDRGINEMKMTTEFTENSITNLVQKINDYADKAEEKINIISSDIDRILGEI